MDQLTSLDAGFLEAEDSDPHVSLAIGGVVILEGPVPDFAILKSTLTKRVRTNPRFTQRLHLHPFDVAPPTWEVDSDFNIEHHLGRVALPSPGDQAELCSMVGELMSRRLDRDHPLWRIWVIEGLSDGRWAMLMKIHHCIGDGIASSHLFTMLCDDCTVTSFTDRIRAAHETAETGFSLDRLRRSLSGLGPVQLAGGLWNVSVAARTAAGQVARGVLELTAGLLRPAVQTSLNGPMATMRRFSAARVPLGDVRAICEAFDVTINDVALAALTAGYREMLIRRGERPGPESMRALVPVSVRSTDALGQTDNRVSAMLPYLPVEEPNPVARLRRVHQRLAHTKSAGQRQAGSAFVSATNYLPFMLTAWAVRLLTRLPQHGVTTLATNVPGPAETLHVLGREVLSVVPIPPIALQLRTGVAILSYADHLTFGVLADYDSMPDVAEFAGAIETAVAQLLAHSKHQRAPNDHRGLSLVSGG